MRTHLLICFFVLSGCSTTTSHLGEAKKTTDGDEVSIKDTDTGFIVTGHYSEYQFIRNSERGFTGCARLINDTAREHSETIGKGITFPQWDEIEIIDHGRDLITAVMHVNCRFEYKFLDEEVDVVADQEG
jgi:hypothetical protein